MSNAVNYDKRVTNTLSNGFFLLLGFIAGMLLFSPVDGITTWLESIDWSSPIVANIGVWTSGIIAAFAACATAHAAYSSKKAADAATESVSKWQLQSAYGKYLDVGVKARIKIRWLDAYLKNISSERFNAFYIDEENNLLDDRKNDIDALLHCINDQGTALQLAPQYEKRFINYKSLIKEQTEKLTAIKTETYNLIEETYELSKNHVGLSEEEKKELLSCIENLIINTDMISQLYNQIFESPETDNETKRINIDSYLNCLTSSRHFYHSTIANLNLITSYIDNLVIDSNKESWENARAEYRSSLTSYHDAYYKQ